MIIKGADMMNLQLKNVLNFDKDMTSINDLYHRAFPDNERAPMQTLLKRSLNGKGRFMAVYDDNQWVGLLHVITYKELSYAMYLAIDEKWRGCGYGSAILQYLKENEGHTVMLSIEEVDTKYDNYHQRISRKHFYLKNGFKEMNFFFTEYGVRYEMLYYGKYLEPHCYDELMLDFAGEKYKEIREDD